jgi:hypothetical protein
MTRRNQSFRHILPKTVREYGTDYRSRATSRPAQLIADFQVSINCRCLGCPPRVSLQVPGLSEAKLLAFAEAAR